MAKKVKQKETGLTWANVRVRLGDLVPWDDNPRTSTKKQAQKIIESWQKFGEVQTIAISPKLDVYDGHQRLSALLAFYGPDYEVDARQLSRLLTYEERQELSIVLHAGAVGSFNWDKIANWDSQLILKSGLDSDYLKGLNLGAAAMGEMFRANAGGDPVDAEPQIDRAGELREKWGTARGQVWTLGNHRLMCGDSTSAEDVARLMGGERASMVFTDPPYALFGNSTGVSGIADDKMVRPFFRDIATASMQNTEQFGHVYVCCDWHTAAVIQDVMCGVGLTSKNLCIWDKGDGGIGANYQNCYEMIWFFTNSPKAKGTLAKKATGERTVTGVGNIWRVKRVPSERIHNAEKPVEMVSIPIKCGSNDGAIVADWFSGSGTTLIACEQLGRKCRAMEIAPGYVAVALQRWADATGSTPTL